MSDRFWKVLGGPEGLSPVHGGSGDYPGLGKWTEPIIDLEACRRGYHIAQGPQLVDWFPSGDECTFWEVTPGDVLVDAGDKWVTNTVRLDRRWDADATMLRLFAADAAESTLLGERASGREPDPRLWAAVGVARRFAAGEASDNERRAAGVAAWAAARDAAWDAARAVDGAAARDAAWAAARAASAAVDGAVARAAAAAVDGATDGAVARAELYDLFVGRLIGQPMPVTPLYGVER